MKYHKFSTKKITAIKDSIKHWEIMIEWVKTQKPQIAVDPYEMYLAIDQSSRGDDCPLCQITKKDTCNGCPLKITNNHCEEPNSVWAKVSESNTWKEWLINAKKMLKTLKSLIKE